MQGSTVDQTVDRATGVDYVRWRIGTREVGSGSYEGCHLRTLSAETLPMRDDCLVWMEQLMRTSGCRSATVLAYGDRAGDFRNEHRFYQRHGYTYVQRSWWERLLYGSHTNWMTKKL